MKEKERSKESKIKKEIFEERLENNLINSAMMMDHTLPGQIFMNEKEKKKTHERMEDEYMGIDDNAYIIKNNHKKE